MLLFLEFRQMHIKMFQKLEGSDLLDLGIASTDDKLHLAIPLSSSRQ